MKKILSYFLFYVIQFTWGVIMNIFGIIIALFMLITLHRPYMLGPSIYFICKKAEGFGFEAGVFFIIGADCRNDEIMLHEAGHGIQNMLFGPITIFIISIPSMIRYWYREIKYYNNGLEPEVDYDAIWFEKTATSWGEKFYYNAYEKLISKDLKNERRRIL